MVNLPEQSIMKSWASLLKSLKDGKDKKEMVRCYLGSDNIPGIVFDNLSYLHGGATETRSVKRNL